MAYCRQLNDDIVCIDTGQHRPQMAACYLVGGDGHYAFVESGTSLSVPGLLDTLEELGVDRGAVDYVMPTHVHLDHAGGAGALLRKLPNARLVIHPRGARHMIDPSQLIAGATAVYGSEAMRATYGEIVPVPESRVIAADVAPDRDFELLLGNRRLQFIDAPGHARHHYAIWDEASRGGSRATYSDCLTANSTAKTAITWCRPPVPSNSIPRPGMPHWIGCSASRPRMYISRTTGAWTRCRNSCGICAKASWHTSGSHACTRMRPIVMHVCTAI